MNEPIPDVSDDEVVQYGTFHHLHITRGWTVRYDEAVGGRIAKKK